MVLVPDTLKSIISAIAETGTIEKVVLYGSRAKGNYRTGSDIDITLKGDTFSPDIARRVETQPNNRLGYPLLSRCLAPEQPVALGSSTPELRSCAFLQVTRAIVSKNMNKTLTGLVMLFAISGGQL